MGTRRSEVSVKSIESLYFNVSVENSISYLKDLLLATLNSRELQLVSLAQ